MALRALLTKLDRLPETAVVAINMALACFIALAHGGALAITFAKPTPQADDIRQLAIFSLPLAAVVLFSGGLALLRREARPSVLAVHGFVLGISALLMLAWALSLIVIGLPTENFVWTTGILTIWIAYTVFVMSRYSVGAYWRQFAGIHYSPLIALFVVLPIDLGVAMRMLTVG